MNTHNFRFYYFCSEAQLTKNLGKIASSLILLNGLYLTTLVSGKFDPVQAVGLVSFASIPIAFQFLH